MTPYDENYGLLVNSNTTLHRMYFKEMAKLLGIRVIYRAPAKDKHYTTYAEIESNYQKPMLEYCIFEDHPSQQTLKKLGWVSELQDTSSIIHVRYDLPDLQQGALFVVPGGLDNSEGRLFRVIKISNIMIFPSSVACEIVPEYEDTLVKTEIEDYSNSSFNLLNQEDDSMFEYPTFNEEGK